MLSKEKAPASPGFIFYEEDKMDWMQIFSALALAMFIVVLFPGTREMLKNSPKGTPADWLGFLVPVGIVILFIVLLIELV